ncbi:uncharacterized protein B4U80_01249, partial [Leptotrombidium deliense]
TPETLKGLLDEFQDVFQEKKEGSNIEVTLEINENAPPKFVKARPVPFALRKKVEESIQSLVKKGILEPVRSSKWASAIVSVLKPDGSIRICGDYKSTVNPHLRTDIHPMPTFNDVREKLGGNACFSKIDLEHAYQQFRLADEKSKELTTINTHIGLFRYTRLPFGVSAAAAIFQRQSDRMFRSMSGVANFVDDIVPSGKTEKEHLQNLRKVFEVMRENGIHANKKKCKFGVSRISYIGHDFIPGGVMPSPDKVKAIKKAPEPKNVTQLKSYLGGLGYYGRFMPNLSSTVEKLYKLTQKDTPWKWTNVERTAFNKSKDLLLSDAVLTHFMENEDLYLVCDASQYGIGVILEHRINGERKPICFWSRVLSKAERNYSQLEKESLAIIYGLFKAYEYVYGRLVYIVTDHKPLLALLGENKPIPEVVSPRVIRWAIRLSAFKYVLIYSKGADIGNADALSRLPVDPPPENKQDVDHVLMLTDESKIINFKEVKDFTRRDTLLAKVKQFTLSSWPAYVEEDLKPFSRRRDEICIVQDCLLWGDRRTTSNFIIGCLRQMCATHGIFEEITTDNGPQFVSSEFEEWCKKNNIRHTTATPYHPASNGIAERAVQTFKQGFKKQTFILQQVKLQVK